MEQTARCSRNAARSPFAIIRRTVRIAVGQLSDTMQKRRTSATGSDGQMLRATGIVMRTLGLTVAPQKERTRMDEQSTHAEVPLVGHKVKPVVQCCKSCDFWDIAKAQDKIGRVRKDAVARCLWKLTEPLPDSVQTWSKPMVLSTSWMGATYGKECACWRPRTLNPTGQNRHTQQEDKP